jgi:hypothetical protein
VIAPLLAILLAAAPEHIMNEPFVAALDRALTGDPKALQGLGVEQQTVTSPLWDDRVSVDGAGVVTVTSRRPSGDAGGAPAGLFRGKLEKPALLALLTALRKLAIAPPPPARSEAYETRVLLSAVVDGQTFGLGAPAFPPALAPLQPVLGPLGAAMFKAMQTPLRSLSLALALPEGVLRGAPVPVVLHLINAGSEGYWVSNPQALSNQPEHDRVGLVYARPLLFVPGVAPVPVPPKRAALVTRNALPDAPHYVWIPPLGDVAMPLQATVEAGDAAELVFRAELFAEEGPELVAGQPRLRASVFSADVAANVK